MKTIDVFQRALNQAIPLEYVGQVKYIGESFGVESLTNGATYDVVYDADSLLKIVDDSKEDYIYDLKNPRPADGRSKGGIFHVVDDPTGVLRKAIEETIW